MNYGKYQNARDAAWRVLLETQANSLPVKITSLAKHYNLNCLSYTDGAPLIAAAGLEHHPTETDGFLLRLDRDRAVILYDDTRNRQRCRFTIAHELGHWLLGHSMVDGTYTAINREPDPTDHPEEHEANVFASRILAPACVLWALDIHTPEQIATLCDVSLASATFRAERMRLLYEREKDFMKRKGRSCFLQSPQEKEVFEQFRAFIQSKVAVFRGDGV